VRTNSAGTGDHSTGKPPLKRTWHRRQLIVPDLEHSIHISRVLNFVTRLYVQRRQKSGAGNEIIAMTSMPIEIVSSILANPTSLDHVRRLVSDDFTYVSLNYEHKDLKRVMPWCGTSRGAESLVKTFVDVGKFWRVDDFTIEATFGQNENVAVFGRFTYTSTVLAKQVTSPFAVFAKVSNGRCTYMQFMEDTFATGASFRSGGVWHFRSDPDGGEVSI
jgi:uncharacterized protein